MFIHSYYGNLGSEFSMSQKKKQKNPHTSYSLRFPSVRENMAEILCSEGGGHVSENHSQSLVMHLSASRLSKLHF